MTDFVCQVNEEQRSACEGLPFYDGYEGKQYCVLHHPSKEKDTDFWKVVDQKLEDRNFDFSGTYFPDHLNLEFFVFDSRVDFSAVTFEHGATFRQATFARLVNFSHSTFSGTTDFSEANFGCVPKLL